ncbi:MAG: FliH/SctL family protein [Bacteriovoracaceae bacterium]|jgi:flagellar assembly protein FliH|nr:FliH/SctL family protein [Bacteriovoracaceae bacterium]
MTVYKNNKLEVKKFEYHQFSDPQNLSPAKAYEFKDLSDGDVLAVSEEQIRLERSYIEGSGFEVSKHVKELRGLARQEQEDLDNLVSDRVGKEFQKVSGQAYEEGLSKGIVEGQKQGLEQTLGALESKTQVVEDLIKTLTCQNEEFFKHNKVQVLKLIQNVTKWICLKEISEDKVAYHERLLMKVIAEINTKKNLTIKVSKALYEQIPDIIKKVEANIGKLENVNYEISSDIDEYGLIIESENGIVDASVDTQMEMLKQLFFQEE